MPRSKASPTPAVALASRLLDSRPGEVYRGVLLFSYLFLVVGAFVVGKATRDALFLHRFSALKLPYVDIAVAVVVSVWVAAYIRVGRYVSLRTILACSLALFGLSSIAFWYIARYHGAPWVLPVIYIWVGMFGVIGPAQVWTLANYVLTTREAKRLVGFIGSGAVAGGIVGGLLVQMTAPRLGADSPLVGMAVALFLCIGLVFALWRQRHLSQASDGDDAGHATSRRGPAGLRAAMRLIARSRYLRSIAAVICLSSFVTAVAAWQFKAVARETIPDRDQLAAFFGAFNVWAGMLALALQLLLTSRLLRRLGLGFALFVVPVALTMSSVGYLALGTLATVVLVRGSDQVLRYSIDRPTVELLYLPVPQIQTFQVKSFIDTVVWRLGDGLAGLTILLFGAALHWPTRQITWVNLILLGGWLAAAWAAQRQYVVNLGESIYNYRLDAERASATVLDKAATEILASRLHTDDPRQILYALELFGASHRDAAHPAVRGLLGHASPEVRQAAVRALDAAGDRSIQTDVERLLYDGDIGVRTEAMLYVAHHAGIDPLERIEKIGDFEDFSIRSAMVSFLSRPGPTQNLEAAHVLLGAMVADPNVRTRVEAARLLRRLPDEFDAELEALVNAPEAEVAAEAIEAAGIFRKRSTVPLLIPRLAHDELVDEITEALSRFGDRVVEPLREQIANPGTPLAVRRAIPGVLLRIGTDVAEHALSENLLDADTVLRFRVLAALNKLRASNPSRPLDVQLVETVLAAEIMGHLRSYQLLGTLDEGIDSREPVAQALRESMTQEVERIFRLLKLLFPANDMHSAFVGLQSDNRVVHDNALEFVDTVLKPQLRELLVPLLDRDVSTGQRVEVANRVLGTSVASREEAVAMLALSADPWLQSCAAYAIGTFELRSLATELDRWVEADDPLLRETARQARRKLARSATA
jgi:AAA family ATP:ADP antiporter